MKKNISRGIGKALVGIGIFAIFVSFSVFISSPAHAQTVVVHGDVKDTNSDPMENVEMWLYEDLSVETCTTYTAADGTYTFSDDCFNIGTLEVGDYVALEARTPAGYNAVTNQINFTWDGSTYSESPVAMEFVVAPKILSGTITFDQSGDPASQVNVVAYPVGSQGVGSVQTVADQNGDYSMNLRAGVPAWNVQAIVNLSDYNTMWLPTAPPVMISFTNNNTTETETLNFTVEATQASISAEFLDANGDPLTSDNFQADCSIFKSDGVGTIRKVDANSELNGIGLPPGVYSYWCFHNALDGQSFSDPSFVLQPNETKDLGTIQAEVDSSAISGTVTDTEGSPIFNKQITASHHESPKFLTVDTDQNGDYSFTVGQGSWTIGIRQGPGEQYIMASPISVTIEDNGDTSTGNDFQLIEMNQNLNGQILSLDDGEVLDSFSGFVFMTTEEGGYYSALVENGAYQINFPTNLNNQTVSVGVVGDLNAFNGLAEFESVTLVGNTTLDLELSMNSLTISGDLKNSSALTITPAVNEISVIAVDNFGNFRKNAVAIDGSYSLDVIPGSWNLAFKVEDDSSNYLASSVHKNIVEVTSQNVTLDLTVKERDATISGSVIDADGNSVAVAPVFVANLPILEEQGEFDPEDIIEISTNADENGDYSVSVPAGNYLVFAGSTPDLPATIIEPQKQEVTATAGATATVDLAFIASDATLIGSVLDADGNAVSSGNIVAFTEAGGYVDGDITALGTYSLSVISGQEWKVMASSLDGSDLLLGSATLSIEAGSNSLNISLADSGNDVPGSITKEFESEDFINLSLPNGGRAQFSPFAIDSTGTVSISFEPRIDLSPSASGEPVSITYNIIARNSDGVEVNKLNNPVRIIMPYSADFLASKGVLETNLVPQFFAENEERWSSNGLVTLLNTDYNQVVIYSDHLTKFGINGAVTQDPDLGIQDPDPLGIIMTPASAGGPNVRVVDQEGEQISSFFAYQQDIRGEFRTLQADIDGDGVNEIIAYTAPGFGPNIRAFELDGTLLDWVMAFDENFRGGVIATAGDYDGDGKDEIAVTPESLGGPNIRIYDFEDGGFELKSWFFAYDEDFHGGANLASGDVDGDGNSDLVVTPISHGGPNVRVYYWDGNSFEVLDWFFAYQEEYHGGVQLAVGDVNGDNKADIITIPYVNGGPNVRVYYWDGNSLELLDWVMAYQETYRGTLNAVTGDVDGNGTDEVILVPLTDGGPNVRIYEYTNNDLSLYDWFMAYDENFRAGVNLTALDIDSDGYSEIITAPYRGNPNVRVYELENGSENLNNWFWGLPETFTGGVNFAK